MHDEDIIFKHNEKNKNSPVLSAQLITAPTGKPRDILNFAPAVPPRPEKHKHVCHNLNYNATHSTRSKILHPIMIKHCDLQIM